MNNATKWGRATLVVAVAAAAFLAFASGGPAGSVPRVAPATVLASGGENDPPPDTPPPGADASAGAPSAGAADRNGAGRPAPDKAALTDALLVLITALDLRPEDLVECADMSGTGARPGAAGGCDPAAGAQNTSTITISKRAFGAPLTVAPGSTVTVVNNDKAPHNVTSSTPGAFSTTDLRQGASATFTAPTTAGRYEFVCTIHPDMVGTLVVAEAGSGSGRGVSSPPGRAPARGDGAMPHMPGGPTDDTTPGY